MILIRGVQKKLQDTCVIFPGISLGEIWFIRRKAICEAVASICLTSCFCSLLSIGAVSFNRFVHICHNEAYNKIFTKRNSIFMCIGLWVTSFMAEMSCFIGWGGHSYDKKTLSCVWDRTADFSYTLFFATVGVAFPVVLITICYVKIYHFVRASKLRVSAIESIADKTTRLKDSSQAESAKLARTLFIIFAVFTLCWTPYAIVVVADRYDTFPMEVHIFAILVAHTNSSLNSVLYGLTNMNFRRGYAKLLNMCFSWCPCLCKALRHIGTGTNLTHSISHGNEEAIQVTTSMPTKQISLSLRLSRRLESKS